MLTCNIVIKTTSNGKKKQLIIKRNYADIENKKVYGRISMSFKIVIDSCGELPDELKRDERFESVPLTLIVGDTYEKADDGNFDQREFLDAVAACPTCPKSACPSPERYMEAYNAPVDRIYAITLSSKLSGSYNSAVLGKNLYHETYGEKNIYVVDSRSASCGQTQIAFKIMEWENEGRSFEEITQLAEEFVKDMSTYFVLNNLDTLRKNGRLSRVKAVVASTLSIKPVMAGDDGSIVQLAQCIGMKKGLAKMVEIALKNATNPENRTLMITHCNNPKGAESVRQMMEEGAGFKQVVVMDTAGISSMYANDGGIIMTL